MRVRFAPSPTGFLHIGGARTALFNWIYAKKENGIFVLRIEDTDPERSKREHEEQICRDMGWLGLNWDEGPKLGGSFGPYRQSERMDRYNIHIEQLLNSNRAYRCTCTTEELDQMRAQQREAGQLEKYDGRCRTKNLGPDCGVHVIRFAMPLEGETVVDDGIKGPAHFNNKQLDDFILIRSDGTPTYNFVVVVDDIEMQITDVIRGDDHLNNTPKQINLYHALGATPPRFAHLPLILGPDGKRLSKRHGATAVGMYRELGIIKEALFNYLTRLGWAHEDLELFSAEEVSALFGLSGISKSGAKWDMQKLLWVNQQWIMKLDPADLAERTRPFFERAEIEIDEEIYLHAITTMQERAQTLIELAEGCRFYFAEDRTLSHDAESAERAFKPETLALLDRLSRFLETAEWEKEKLQDQVKQWVGEESTRSKAQGGKKIKLGQLLFPLRIALCGGRAGPDLFDVMMVLGSERTITRLKHAYQTFHQA